MNRYGDRYGSEDDRDWRPRDEAQGGRRADFYRRPGSVSESQRPGDNWRTWGQGGTGEPWQRAGTARREPWEGRHQEGQPPFRGYSTERPSESSYDRGRDYGGYPTAYDRGYDWRDQGEYNGGYDEQYSRGYTSGQRANAGAGERGYGGYRGAYDAGKEQRGSESGIRSGYNRVRGGEYGGYESWRDFDDRGHLIHDEEDRFLRLYGGPRAEHELRTDRHEGEHGRGYGPYNEEPERGVGLGDGTMEWGRAASGYGGPSPYENRRPHGGNQGYGGASDYGDRYPGYQRGSSRDWLMGRAGGPRRNQEPMSDSYGYYADTYDTGMSAYARSGGAYRYEQGRQRFPGSGGVSSGPYAGRGPRGYRRSDERIREEVCQALYDHAWMNASDLSVEVQDGVVTLHGDADNRDQKRLAEDVAERVMGVKDVQNQLKVKEQGRVFPGQAGSEDMMGVTAAGSRSTTSDTSPTTAHINATSSAQSAGAAGNNTTATR